MSEIVERAARALFQRDVDEDICDGTWEESPALHDKFFADARVAIEAMREPTSSMMNCESSPYSPGEMTDFWHAMIDEALR